MERLSKIMSHRGLCSRREAERIIDAGEVLVDGMKINKQGMKFEDSVKIEIVGSSLKWKEKQKTILLHKPIGIVSTMPEGEQIPAWHLITEENSLEPANEIRELCKKPWTFSVAGRLDRASRGLLIMTQDGRMTKLITAGHSIEKEYEVTVDKRIITKNLKDLTNMRRIAGKPILQMTIKKLGDNKLGFILKEGKKHQIRDACRKVGLTVTDLYRIRIGKWKIDGLQEGKWRII